MPSQTVAATKLQIKKILLDPVAEYQRQFSQYSDEVLTTLDQLQKQYNDINLQLKDNQDKSKRLSRKIGEAKREQKSCNELLQAMRQHSEENKALKNQLEFLSEKILSLFEAQHDDNSARHHTTTNYLPPGRQHAAQTTANNQPTITLLTDDNDTEIQRRWNEYVAATPGTSLYHRYEWKNLVETVFGHECYYFYAHAENEIIGLLPLVRLKSLLFGDFMVSMPYFNSGGAIANSLTVEHQLMQAANAQAEKLGSEHIEYRDDISREKLPVRDEKVNMILALPDSVDLLWQSFSSKLRSQIRRPQRENTNIETGGLNCLEDFYTVFAHNMRDLGTPVYSKSFFSQILSTFPESSKIVIVRLNNKPVAAAFLLAHNEILEIPWASTIKRVNHLSMNMLLYWEVLKFAVDSKCRFFDFGRSSKDSGTYRFKQQWGAKPKQCYWHYWLKGGAELPALNPNNPKFKLVIATWQKMPVWLTKIIGPGIVKNLP